MSAIDFVIAVALGGRRIEVPVAELAAAVGVELPRLRAALLGLLHGSSSQSSASPQEEGGKGGWSFSKLRERNDNLQIRSVRSEPFGEDEGPGDSERLADYLADVFRDDKSLAFYKLVAASVPREVVRDALARALDVPRHEVRRSRAAIFTALVRPHLPRRSSSP